MKYIKTFEALKPSTFKKYVSEWKSNELIQNRYEPLFKELGSKYEHDKKYYRIYIPLNKIIKPFEFISNTHREISKFLEENDCIILDYINGVAKYKSAKNNSSIAKLLNKFGEKELLKDFISDESRKAMINPSNDMMIVLCRHPYDVVGSDTDRNWTNCMTLTQKGRNIRVDKLSTEYILLKQKLQLESDDSDEYNRILKKIENLEQDIEFRKTPGANVAYLINDVRFGTLSAYLIKKDDKNIENPLASISIKPYISTKYIWNTPNIVRFINNPNQFDNEPYDDDDLKYDDYMLLADNKMYGMNNLSFKSSLNDLLDMINNDKDKNKYMLHSRLYI